MRGQRKQIGKNPNSVEIIYRVREMTAEHTMTVKHDSLARRRRPVQTK